MAKSLSLARPKHNRFLGVIAAVLSITAIPVSASANDSYDTAIACAGGLDYLSTMLPPGTEPATDARTRSDAWKTEAQRLSRKGDSSVMADIRSSSNETSAIMMGGDQTKVAAHFGELNDTCAQLPEEEPAAPVVANPFGLTNPTTQKTYETAVACAGRYHIDASNGDDNAKKYFNRFLAVAEETRPELPPKTLKSNVQKATTEWMMMALNMDPDGPGVTAMCKDAYAHSG